MRKIREAFRFGKLPEGFVLPDWDYNVAPQRVDQTYWAVANVRVEVHILAPKPIGSSPRNRPVFGLQYLARL